MAIIRDKKLAVEKIERILNKHKDSIAWVKIDSVDIPNKATGRTDTLTDVYFYATGKGSDRPKIICGYKDSRNYYVLHDEIAHVNVGNLVTLSIPNSKCNKFLARAFCNPVKEIHLWNEPVKSKNILKGNLTDTNPGNPMRGGIKSTRIDSAAYIINTEDGPLKNDATLEQMAARTYDINSNLSLYAKDNIMHTRKRLQENHDLNYAYVAYNNDIQPNFNWFFLTTEELESGDYITQDYYKTYTYKDIDETFTIPKAEYDVLCVGVGSAGSNILEQLIKINLFSKYHIVDFDRIENKNTRNQIYGRNESGVSKVQAMKSFMDAKRNSSIEHFDVKTDMKKFEHVHYEEYKYKYVISAFDNIECRIALLDKVKSNEIEGQYLIDTRYDDLTSTLLFIDLSNPKEVEYYEKQLLETQKQMSEEKVDYNWTLEDISRLTRIFYGGRCSEEAYRIGLTEDMSRCICNIMYGRTFSCGGTVCHKCIQEAMIKQKVKRPNDGGCTAQNIIHIYKLTSTWVTTGILSLEQNNKKPFTHVDMTVDPLPKELIIRP